MYSVNCSACSRQLEVTAAQAGSSVQCNCGQLTSVPRMSQLRASAGESAIPLTIVATIHKHVGSGELPLETLCPLSHRPANETLRIQAICEQSWSSGGTDEVNSAAIALGCIFGWLGFLAAQASARPEEKHGRNTIVELPLRISSDARGKYERQSQKQLNTLLKQTPIYAELLKEFPNAKLRLLDE